MIKSGIYQLEINGRIYIGSTKNFSTRRYQHERLLKRKEHFNIHLQRLYNKYGYVNFSIVLYCPVDCLVSIENEYLEKKFLVNISKNAESPMRGRKHKEESKDKLRGKPGVKWTPERKRRFQKKLTPEVRFRMGSARRGKSLTKQHKKAIAERNRNYEWTEEQRRAVGERTKKPVVCYCTKTGKILHRFDSVVDACKELNESKHKLYSQVQGKTKGVGLDKMWRYE